ncbi:MAG: eukaryotic-like serine/threonine-protein kinase [Solirubrobacteraceae bacterium]|jgi:serine/threonine-protein kinase|nr:eukaryotic-like serine/threonine-protein kinase [Solirubrobacteraceae bacterium]
MSVPTPNTLIDGRYKVLRRLGSGGMAEVFLAEDQQLGRQVALKLLHDRFAADPDFVERFRREARAAAGLQHPNVVSVYDRGRWEDTYYIAMEYLPGRSLKELIHQEAPLDPVRAIDITIQILKAARFAHRRGVIHRDLKPHNVIIDESDQAKVTDFGIARAGASDMTETGSIMGTSQYLSPEQAQGHAVESSSDLYSIGVVLYELITGRVPFDGDAAVTIALKHVSEAPRPPHELNPRVPPELEQVVLWVLNKNPADRPASADEFIAALESARASILSGDPAQNTAAMAALAAGAGGLALGGLPEPVPYPPPSTNGTGEHYVERRRGWRPWLLGLLAILLIAGGAAAAYLLTRTAQAKVPSVTGDQVNVARDIVQNAGFQAAVIPVPSNRQAGVVIGEDPSGGSMADKNSTVSLSVSQGPSAVSVPSVVGQTESSARATLRRHHLKSRIVLRPSSQFVAGDAIGTDPRSGQAVAPGTQVTLFISSGPPKKLVPDVTAETASAARTQLTNAGFTPRTTTQTSTTATPGNVISQSPAGGTTAAPGSDVTIVVAQAPKKVSVPSVVGLKASAAANKLNAAGFKVVPQKQDVTDPTQNGKVIKQAPAGGQKVKPGSSVTIIVGHLVSSSSTTTTTSSSSTTPTTSSSSTTSPAGVAAP